MNLDAQIQELVDHAPQDGSTPALVEAIAPVLKQLAGHLRHLQYYTVQTLDGDWAFTVLGKPSQPETEKRVIYAYPTLQDVASSPYGMNDPQIIAMPVGVTHILFQLLAMENIDSLIFFETPGNLVTGTEISRADLAVLMESYFSNLQAAPPEVPPNIA